MEQLANAYLLAAVMALETIKMATPHLQTILGGLPVIESMQLL
jgi:hypothetical protein